MLRMRREIYKGFPHGGSVPFLAVLFPERLTGIAASAGPVWCKRIPFPAIQPAADGIRVHNGIRMPINRPVTCEFFS